MNLKRKCSFLFYVGICLISCTEKEESEQDFFLEISERKKFIIGESGLTPDPIYFVSLDSSRSKGVIFNSYAHSLDSIFMSPDSTWIKDGEILDIEGPYGVGNVFSFFTNKDHIVFINPQQFFNQNRETGEVSMKFMHEYGIFGEEEFTAISVPLSHNVSHEYNGLDRSSGVGYFIFDNDKKIRVVGFDSKLDSMYFLPVSLDSINYFQLRFKVRANKLIMGGNDVPQLSVVGSELIVSYPSFSDILVYDLESENHQVFTSTSNSFPSQRFLPQNYADEVDSFELLDELEKSWRSQVRYGPLTFLEDLNKFVRLVKGEGGIDSPYFLEVFDNDFQKIKEFNLSEYEPDISPNYLNTKYGLMFRAKDQPDEDVMYYYYIHLADSK